MPKLFEETSWEMVEKTLITLYYTIPTFSNPKKETFENIVGKETFENIVGKGENASNHNVFYQSQNVFYQSQNESLFFR